MVTMIQMEDPKKVPHALGGQVPPWIYDYMLQTIVGDFSTSVHRP